MSTVFDIADEITALRDQSQLDSSLIVDLRKQLDKALKKIERIQKELTHFKLVNDRGKNLDAADEAWCFARSVQIVFKRRSSGNRVIVKPRGKSHYFCESVKEAIRHGRTRFPLDPPPPGNEE